LEKSIKTTGKDIKIVALENLIDVIWTNQPARPLNPVLVLESKFTGKSSEEKVAELRQELPKKKAAGFIVTALDEVAWLFNLRGSDIAFNPVFFAYSIVTMNDMLLYIDETKLSPEVKSHLPKGVTIKPYESVFTDLATMGKEWMSGGEKIWMDGRCNLALKNVLDPSVIEESRSPIMSSKAIKNAVEMEGFRQCHLRDAAAVCDYIAWLEKELCEKNRVDLTEYQGSQILAGFRAKQSDFVGLSFETISSTGPNAAIIHYAPNKDNAAIIRKDQIYLLDSGGQYKDGTTDITRTMHFGEPKPFEKECFTRVLQGHIGLDTLIFPNGTTGYIIDAIARRPLWQTGLDFRHGTGHGVGSYLNVHEGPHGIGTRISCNDVPLKSGMTITNGNRC
jgi:Xaa-Pro aminopeptidase